MANLPGSLSQSKNSAGDTQRMILARIVSGCVTNSVMLAWLTFRLSFCAEALSLGNARAIEADDAWPFSANLSGVVALDDENRAGLANAQTGVLFRKKDGVLLGIWWRGSGNLLAARHAAFPRKPRCRNAELPAAL